MPYTYEEALKASVEYFNGDELAAKSFVDKYALKDNNENILEKTPTDMHWRIAKEFSRIEKSKHNDAYSAEYIFSLIDKFKYLVPQGSPMSGIGNPYQYITLSNCYVIEPPNDAYNSIINRELRLVNISKRRGGTGIDIGNLRPKNATTTNAARSSTGLASWLERYSSAIREVAQHGRRGALMITCPVNHPEIDTFITIKNDKKSVTGANLSTRIFDGFMQAVFNDKEYTLEWHGTNNKSITKNISAKELWNKIIYSAWLRAEPGLLFWDNILKGPADCYDRYRSVGVNPCAELSLCAGDSCRLLALCLVSYVVNPYTKDAYFDFELFSQHVRIATRLLDDMVNLEAEKIQKILDKINNDPEPESEKAQERQMWLDILSTNNDGRRLGLGITALGDTLAALGIPYGSNESIQTTENIYRNLKYGAYRESVELAKKFGPFKEWNHTTEKNCEFLLRFNEDEVGQAIYKEMKKYGRRNIALLTTAPTGTVSIMTRTTSGIEPCYELIYTRRKKIIPGDNNTRVDFIDPLGDKWQHFKVYHPQIERWMSITGETDITKSPWAGCCADDINWINRIKLQAAAQKHVCHAISSTINLPNDVKEEEVAAIYEAAWRNGCKGITVYRKGCRDGVIINEEDAQFPEKRPRTLDCDVYHITVKGQQYFVLVGKIDNRPYEVFAGKNNVIPHGIKSGKIIRKHKGFYKAIFDDKDETELAPITSFCNDAEEAITRLTSALLREKANMNLIVSQLEKVGGSEMNSFARSIARALKKYIKDGVKTGEICPNEDCGGELLRENGCVICKNCGFSKCS